MNSRIDILKASRNKIKLWIEEFLENQDLKLNKKSRFRLKLILTEMMGNSFCHGNKGIDESTIKVEWDLNDRIISISIKDEGSGFDFKNVLGSELKKEDSRGRGIFMVKQMVDELTFLEGGSKVAFRVDLDDLSE